MKSAVSCILDEADREDEFDTEITRESSRNNSASSIENWVTDSVILLLVSLSSSIPPEVTR